MKHQAFFAQPKRQDLSCSQCGQLKHASEYDAREYRHWIETGTLQLATCLQCNPVHLRGALHFLKLGMIFLKLGMIRLKTIE